MKPFVLQSVFSGEPFIRVVCEEVAEEIVPLFRVDTNRKAICGSTPVSEAVLEAVIE